MTEIYKWINWRNAKYDSLNKPKTEPVIDKEISQIAGKKVFTNDPRLIKTVIEFRNKKSPDNDDNFLKNPEFRERIKQVFNS